MAWNPNFPTPATRISQSVQQIQDNWNFLQNSINTDHFYNSGAPNEGHHRFVQLINQGADPAVAVSSVFYSKIGSGGGTQPFFRNAAEVRGLATFINGATIIGGAGTATLAALAGRPSFSGFVMVYRVGGTGENGCAFVVWDGFNARVRQLSVSGGITALGEAGTNITVTTTGAMNLEWQIINIQI